MENVDKFELDNQNMIILSFAMDNIKEAAFLIDEEGRFHYVNAEACRILGYNRNELLSMKIEDINIDFKNGGWSNYWKDLRKKKSIYFESHHLSKDGILIPVAISANYFIYNNFELDLGLVRDLSDRIENETKNHAYVTFLTIMDRINQILLSTNDLQNFLSNLVDEILMIFACDRVFLLQPVEIKNNSWFITNISCQDEYKIIIPDKNEVTLEKSANIDIKSFFAQDDFIQYGSDFKIELFSNSLLSNEVISGLALSIIPKLGKPWILNLQQCSNTRIWTSEEQNTLKHIARRISDALTSFLSFENLQESEEKFRSLIETSNEGIILIDIDSTITYVNKRVIEIFKYSEIELIGHSVTLLMLEEDFPDHYKKIENRKSSIAEIYERRAIRKDGSIIWIQISASPFMNKEGNYNGSFAMISDITEYKNANKEILKLNRVYLALSSCNEALVHAQNEMELLNKICTIIIEKGGYKLAWVGYAQDDEFKTVTPVAYAGTGTSYVENLKISWGDNEYGRGPTGKAIRFNHYQASIYQNDEDFAVWKNRAEEHGYASGVSIPLNIENKTSGAISIYSGLEETFNDDEISLLQDLASDLAYGITNLRIRNQIQKLNENLEERVIERTNQLEILNKELESFSYSVSHDLQSPLRHISEYLNLLQKELGDKLNAKEREYFAKIFNSTEHMTQIIDVILSISVLEHKELNFSEVNLSQIVISVIKEFEPDLKDRNVNWDIYDLPTVNGDENLLRQVFINLLSNALKFTEKTKVALIKISSIIKGNENVIIIEDNGIGFDMKDADKLFGAFNRLHSDMKFQGTGIGLANVRRIIERHGGRTWAESDRNNGAKFYFSLPLQK